LNNEVKTDYYTSTFDIPCSTFCGSLLTVGEVRTKPHNPFIQPGVEAYKRAMFALIGKPGFEKEALEMKNQLKGMKRIRV